ncbi:MAG TPA: TolC family protein [Vicinamibacterales bacterium]|jgi:outer membrane protein TolC|nr:TolC family protein [Vicinamibacterales bacterium]
MSRCPQRRQPIGLLVSTVLLLAFFGVTTGAQAPAAPTPAAPSRSAPSQPASSAAPLSLTLDDAIARGLRENINARLQEADVTSARGDRWVALKDLLPQASVRLTLTRQEINLAAFGFSLPGFPNIVGPFNLHDSRLSVSQPLVDLHALYESRSGAANLRAAELTQRDTRELVALAVRDLYLQAVTADSRSKASRVQSDTARALLTLATDLKNAGVVPGIDVLRAQVQVRTQEQRAIVAGNDFEKLKLQLARAVGLPLAQDFVLADTIPYAPLQTLPLEEALKQALMSREDYRAAQARLEAAEAAKRAAFADNLPSLHLNADYGVIGRTPADTHSTYSVSAQLRIPVFDAATTRGHVLEAEGLLARRGAELNDYRARVEYEVRAAYLDLRAADDQLQAAQDAMNLAGQELEQTRDRFAAGVAGNIEVVQAQETVVTATESYISSLYAHNLAKASLAHAIGGTAAP